MVNVAENIIIKRSAHILQAIISKDVGGSRKEYKRSLIDQTNMLTSLTTPFEEFNSDISFNLCRRFEDLLSLVFEGVRVKRFVVVNTEDPDKTVLPIYLAEIMTPSHAYLPIFIGSDSILLVSPFANKLMAEALSGNEYLAEMMPTSTLLSVTNIEELNGILDAPLVDEGSYQPELLVSGSDDMIGISQTQMEGLVDDIMDEAEASAIKLDSGDSVKRETLREYITRLATVFSVGIKNQDRVITTAFGVESSIDIVELTPDNSVMQKIKRIYNAEAMDKYSDDGVISPTDYMPIRISYKDSDEGGFGFLADRNKDGKNVPVVVISKAMINNPDNETRLRAILTKDNIEFGVNYVVELGPFYYIGRNMVMLLNYDGTFSDPIKLFDEFPIPDNTPLAKINVQYSAESIGGITLVGDAMRGFKYIVTKFGLKTGSFFFLTFAKLFATIGNGAKWIVKTMSSTFQRGIDLEKSEALELQEKILNDELDEIMERGRTWSQIYFRTIPLTIATGTFVMFPFMWLIARNRTKKAKLKALERVERKMDDAIERLERKMNYAEERSENESVDSILREIQLYRTAKQKILDYKRDNFKSDRIQYSSYNREGSSERY